jgi:hypothetical protein
VPAVSVVSEPIVLSGSEARRPVYRIDGRIVELETL